MFCCCRFFLLFRSVISKLPQPIASRLSHMLKTDRNLRNWVRNSGRLSLKILRPKAFWAFKLPGAFDNFWVKFRLEARTWYYVRYLFSVELCVSWSRLLLSVSVVPSSIYLGLCADYIPCSPCNSAIPRPVVIFYLCCSVVSDFKLTKIFLNKLFGCTIDI